MKISYKKRLININLKFGLVWLVLFFIGISIEEEFNWINYGWLLISLMYIANWFHMKYNKYLTIENQTIKVNSLFGKKIYLTDIKQIKKFVGDYILKTDTAKLIINTDLIDKKSLEDLNTELEKLDLE